MNLNSEIEFFGDLRVVDKARLLNLFVPWTSYADRFINELNHRLTRVIEQLLSDDATRPADDVLLRMLLTPRADKVAERLVFNAYGRAIQGFESYDTTVLMGPDR